MTEWYCQFRTSLNYWGSVCTVLTFLIITNSKFTVEGTQGNGAIPFLDTLVTPLADNSLTFEVYQRPTHTDQYLQWDSHHSLSAKYSVIGTLTHRVTVVCTDPDILQSEINHLTRALGRCN